MALNPVQLQPKTSGGKGGLFGKIAGGVVGGVAGAFAGGPVGALKGASLGSSVGGMIGGIADPAKQTGGQGVHLSALAKEPGVQFANLVDAHKTLMASPDFAEPEKMELSQNVFMPAIEAMKKRNGVA